MHIDWWTLGIQTVNVAVLVWLLQRFFWRPVSAMIAQRRDAAQAALAEAKASDSKAKAALADVERTRAGFAAEHAGILKQAHDAATKADAATQAAASTKVAALEAAGTAAIAASQKASEKQWADRSAQLAVDIAGKLAGRVDAPAVQSSFLAYLLDHLRAMPEAARKATEGCALEVVSAKAIDQPSTTAAIAKALGTTPTLTYRTDPCLIAGVELHGPHLDVTNSWQADLAKVLSEAKAAGTP